MKKLCGALLGILTLTGCVSDTVSYYTLTPQSISTQTKEINKQNVILLQYIDFPSYLESKKIVTRTSENELKMSDFHRWANALNDEVQTFLVEHLRTNVDNAVISTNGRYLDPTKKLQLEIIRLEKDDAADQVTLSAHWQILDKSNAIKQHGSFNQSVAVNDNSYAATAKAHSKLLQSFAVFLAEKL